MGMKLHELHPSMIHAPLALLPAAAAVDLAAAATGRVRWSRFGARLWTLGAGAGLLAGLAGAAASQEVQAKDKKVDDAMYLHGIGNLALLVAAGGMALYRSRRRPTFLSSAIGLLATGSAIYTAYLGGELVYGSGLGVKAMSAQAREGVDPSVPDLLSLAAPGRFLRDSLHGLAWLFKRTYEVLSGEVPFERGAVSPAGEPGDAAKVQSIRPQAEPLPLPPAP